MDDKTLLSLVEKFGSSDLAELVLEDGALRLSLRKAAAVRAETAAGGPAAAAPAAAPSPAASGAPAAATQALHLGLPAAAPAASGSSGAEEITSPIVATFYRSPAPDSPSFVEVGTKVKAGQTLCILEAMKMMNHLEAEFDCEILAVRAASGDLVEYGQALFDVKRL